MKKLLLLVALASSVMTVAQAQFPGGGRMGRMGGGDSSGIMLIRRADVRADLKLSDDEKDKLATFEEGLMERFRSSFQRGGGPGGGGGGQRQQPTPEERAKREADMKKLMDEIKADLTKIIGPEKMKRLRQINIQISGNRAAQWTDVQKEIGVTPEQATKMKTADEAQRNAMRELFQKMRDQQIDQSAMQEEMKKLTDSQDKTYGEILTEAQKLKLKELGGAKFEAEDE